jgi:hypothetical protein
VYDSRNTTIVPHAKATVLNFNQLFRWTDKPTLRKNKRAAKPPTCGHTIAAHLFLP